MWVITRVQARIDGPFEQALEEIVKSEAADCPCCASVLEASGALPTHCPACGRVRSIGWERSMEDLANHELAQGEKR